MIPLSTAMTQTGAAAELADLLVDVVGGPRSARTAARALRADGRAGPADQQHGDRADRDPVALSAAAEIDVSPRPVLMSLTVAAAASFLTPVATPANLMVMRPGGYRFGDYWKLGLPLLILFGVVSDPARAGDLAVLSMSPPRGEDDRALEPALVSTGSLPTAAQVEALVAEAHERYREDAEGATSSVYPALARADPGLFGVCVIGMSGNVCRGRRHRGRVHAS